MKSIRITVLGAAAAALSMPAGLSFQSAAQATSETSSDTEACQCSCDICVAKHGAKVEEQQAKAPNLPDAPVDIDAEVARILATDLGEVELLVKPAADVGVTAAGVAKLVEVEEVPSASSDERGYMGISAGGDEEGGGALVGSVSPGSPAEKAGLRAGDRIVAAEEMPLDSFEDLVAAVIDLKVGETASLEIERGNDELKLDVVLGKRDVLAPVVATIVEFDEATGALQQIGYSGEVEEEVEEEVEITLPSSSPTLLIAPEGDEKGNTFTFEPSGEGAGAPELRSRIVVVEKEVEEKSAAGGVELRWSTDPGQIHQHSDALPEGYVEIYTRRERRPSAPVEDALRARMAELEAEVAELSKVVAELRAELNRRNPR